MPGELKVFGGRSHPALVQEICDCLNIEPGRASAFNFSDGEQIEVVEMVRRLVSMAGVEVQPIVDNSVQAEIRHMHLCSDKARQRLDWSPRVGFTEGLKRTVDWYLGLLREPRRLEELPSRLLALVAMLDWDFVLVPPLLALA